MITSSPQTSSALVHEVASLKAYTPAPAGLLQRVTMKLDLLSLSLSRLMLSLK